MVVERERISEQKPVIRNEVFLRPDKQHTAYFSSLEGLPLLAAFSWGRDVPNLSEKFGDGQEVRHATWNFLTENGFARPPMMVRINPGEKQPEDVYGGDEYDSFEVTREMVDQHAHFFSGRVGSLGWKRMRYV